MWVQFLLTNSNSTEEDDDDDDADNDDDDNDDDDDDDDEEVEGEEKARDRVTIDGEKSMLKDRDQRKIRRKNRKKQEKEEESMECDPRDLRTSNSRKNKVLSDVNDESKSNNDDIIDSNSKKDENIIDNKDSNNLVVNTKKQSDHTGLETTVSLPLSLPFLIAETIIENENIAHNEIIDNRTMKSSNSLSDIN